MLAGVTIERPETVADRSGRAHRYGHGGRAVRAPAGPRRRSAKTAASAPVRSSPIRPWATASRWGRSPSSGPRPSKPARGSARMRGCAGRITSAPAREIGNFVELKKTRFGAGSKAMHLAYLGDSVDRRGRQHRGRNHHLQLRRDQEAPTMIGDGAFVGSNSTLVAPVEIGAGSYVAAGSVITNPVPRGLAGGGARAPGGEGRLGQAAARRRRG